MACRLVALYKAPGFFPVGIGEIIRRLLTNCVLLVTGAVQTEACGNLNLCARLVVGIEGAVHATLAKYNKAPRPPVADQALLAGGSHRYNGIRGTGKVEEEEELNCTDKVTKEVSGDGG